MKKLMAVALSLIAVVALVTTTATFKHLTYSAETIPPDLSSKAVTVPWK